jgi:hypothetical protein
MAKKRSSKKSSTTKPIAAAEPAAAEQSSKQDRPATAPLQPDTPNKPSKKDSRAEPPVESSTSTVAHEAPAKKLQRTGRRRLIMSLLVLAIILFGAGYWYFVMREENSVRANQTVLAEVSKLAIVPEDEVPSVTTVVDESKVNQEFLRNSKKGDKVLLYFQAGRAIVYRPSSHQIVNMGPLETPKPRVFIRNGSTSKNTDKIASEVRGSADYLVASRDDAPNMNYSQTIIVDLTGNRSDIAQRLAAFLHAKVGQLPDGESKPDADMLVIVGKDASQ